MLTDIVGYSALTQRDERLALALVREQERLVRPIVASHRGRVVKTLGDGFLLEFPSALDAVEGAVDVQQALDRRNSVPSVERIEVRIGIHLGDVVREHGDIFGDAVNVAARLEPLSYPGGACISQPVYDQVRSKVDVPMLPMGIPRLKNIAVPIQVYRLALPSARAPSAEKRAGHRVAVLPLANISGRAEDEPLADGFTEELIQTLSKIAGLRVIGRTSVMRYKGGAQPPAEVAKELGATAIVEGAIQRQGSRVRVTVRLLDPVGEETVWSNRYDRAFRNVFALQSDVSQQVANALAVEVLGHEERALARPLTSDTTAHASYLKGRFLLNQRTEPSLRQAIVGFDQALRRDPRFAQAHAGLADSYSTLAWLEFARPRFAFPRARRSALRAVALDPTLAEAHASLGFVRFLYDRAWVEAEKEFRQSLALNPNSSTAHQYYSDLLKAMGRFDEALVEVRRALELDPLSLGINTALGHVLYLSRQYDRAIAQYRKALELDPQFVQAHLWFGRPYLEKGMFARAIDEVRTATRLSNESTMSLSVLGHAFASAGQTREARQILDRLRARSRRDYVPSYWIALIYTGLQDSDRAFAWLDRADQERSAWLAWIKVEPRFDTLRSDSRFPRLLRRLRLA